MVSEGGTTAAEDTTLDGNHSSFVTSLACVHAMDTDMATRRQYCDHVRRAGFVELSRGPV